METLVVRIQKRINALSPSSPEIKAAFNKIGMRLTNEMKINIRSKGIISGGYLLNSIRYQLFSGTSKIGVEAGSYGVKYAAINEFGGPFTDRMRRAMFASLRARGKLQRDYAKKGVINGSRWKARPYVRPAARASVGYIKDIIKGLR